MKVGVHFEGLDNKINVPQENDVTFPKEMNGEMKIQKSRQSKVWNHFKIKDKLNFLSECNYCGKVTNRKQDIKRHAETHLEGVEHPCENCGKVLRSKNALRQHKCTLNNYF